MAQSVGKDYTGEIEKLSRKKAATASRVADLDRERDEAKQMLDNLEANRKAAVFGALDSIKKRYFGRLLDAPVAKQTAEVPLLDGIEGAEDGGLAVRLEVVEHLFRLVALPVQVRYAARGGGLLSTQLLDFPGIILSYGLGHSLTSDDQEREDADHEQDEAVSESVRDLSRVEDAGQDAVPEAVDDDRDEERDLHVVHDLRQVVGQGTRTGERAARPRLQGPARFQHLREEGHVQDPDRHEEHHERDVDDRDVRGHRDPPLVLGELVLLSVVAHHRQDVGHIAARVGRLYDDGDNPLDHGCLDAGREETQGLRSRNAPGDLSRHLLDLGRQLAVPAAARDHDGIREGHPETPCFRDVAQEVRESSLDRFDPALLLRQEEAVGADESHDGEHEPEEKPFDRPLVRPETQADRADEVQERDEPEESEQASSERHDEGLAIRLLVEPDAGLFELDVQIGRA